MLILNEKIFVKIINYDHSTLTNLFGNIISFLFIKNLLIVLKKKHLAAFNSLPQLHICDI